MMMETTLEVRLPTPSLRLGLDKDEGQHRITEWLGLSLFAEPMIVVSNTNH